MTKQSTDFPTAAKAYVQAKRAVTNSNTDKRKELDRLLKAYWDAVQRVLKVADAAGAEQLAQDQAEGGELDRAAG